MSRACVNALIASYDICRVTPNLLHFVAESCGDNAAAKALLAPRDKLGQVLVDRNALDIAKGVHRPRRAPAGGRRCWCGLTPLKLLDLVEPAGQPA